MTPQELMQRIRQLEEEVQIAVAKFQDETGTRVESFKVESTMLTEISTDPRPHYIPCEVVALVQL